MSTVGTCTINVDGTTGACTASGSGVALAIGDAMCPALEALYPAASSKVAGRTGFAPLMAGIASAVANGVVPELGSSTIVYARDRLTSNYSTTATLATVASIAAIAGTAFFVAWKVSGAVTAACSMHISIYVDGSIVDDLGSYGEMVNSGAGFSFSGSGIIAGLSAGNHSIEMKIKYSGGGSPTIAANTDPHNQGALISAIQVAP